MGKESLKFGDIETEKKIDCHASPIFLKRCRY